MAYRMKIVNDPVYGFIEIPYKILFDIIEHPYFQRLRRISQTGLLSLIYPGARHTRFHHALGAMHLMFLALKTLKLKGVEISEEETKGALIAILLHDVGHGPFSHALESVIMTDCHHEKLSLYLMDRLNQEFNGALSLAIQMFQKGYSRAFFEQLISSQLDVDRMDYLKRDSFYTGVVEGNINSQRIISMMNVHENKLVIESKGVYSVENFLTSRMFMYWQVYFHKTASTAEDILMKILKRAKELSLAGANLPATENLSYFLKKDVFERMTDEDLKRFTELDDSDVLYSIKAWQKNSDFVLRYLCEAVIQRHLPKSLMSAVPAGEEKMHRLIGMANDFYGIPDGQWLVNEIEKTLLPYDTERQPIYLKNNRGEVFRLEESDSRLITPRIMTATTKYIVVLPKEIFYRLNSNLLKS